jgi:hypothetical protein
MTASRKEYTTDLLEDCDAILKDFEGYGECWEGSNKATLIAALVLADAINGLRKSLLQTMNQKANDDRQTDQRPN